MVSGTSLYQDVDLLTTYVARWSAGQSAPELLHGYEPGGNVDEPVFVTDGGINDSGQIVGSSSSSFTDTHIAYFCGTLWSGTTASPVGQLKFFLPSDSLNICNPITLNNAGTVVGRTANGADDAFVATGSTVTRLPKIATPSGPYGGTAPTQYPWASQINQAGTIIAGAMSQYHPVMWVKKDGMWKAKNLGPYNKTTQKNDYVDGEIYGMNERMEVVGAYDYTDAFLWQNGKLVDLNTRVPSGWRVAVAYSINDSGVISAEVYPVDTSGNRTGSARPALLVPVEFKVLAWNPVLTAPIVSYKRDAQGNINKVSVDTEDPDGDIMKAPATIQIKVKTDLPQADALASEWDILLFQNLIVSNPSDTLGCTNGAYVITAAPVPGQDTNNQGVGGSNDISIPQKRSFAQNNDTQSLTLIDSPANAHDTNINLPKGEVRTMQRNNEFITWLFAQHRTSKTRVFLKWIRWRAKYDIEFNFQQNPPDTKKAWDFQVIGKGDGMGPVSPVDTIFTRTHHDTP